MCQSLTNPKFAGCNPFFCHPSFQLIRTLLLVNLSLARLYGNNLPRLPDEFCPFYCLRLLRMAPALIRDAVPVSSDNRSASLISIAAVFLSLSLAALLARLVSKRMKRAPLYIDDLLLIFAWVSSAVRRRVSAPLTEYRHYVLPRQASLSGVRLSALWRPCFADAEVIQLHCIRPSAIMLQMRLIKSFLISKRCAVCGLDCKQS